MSRPLEEAEVRRWRATYSDPETQIVRRSDDIIVRLCDSWLAQGRVIEAARDPFLVILESHPDAEPHVNAEMKRAADNFRAMLAACPADPKEQT